MNTYNPWIFIKSFHNKIYNKDIKCRGKPSMLHTPVCQLFRYCILPGLSECDKALLDDNKVSSNHKLKDFQL